MNERLNGVAAWILYTIAAAMMVFILLPLAVVVASSFSNTYIVTFPPKGFTFNWYVKVLGDSEFQSALKLSLLLAFGSTIGALLLGVPAAIALTRARFRGLQVLQDLVLSPLIFPALVTGLALLQVLNRMGSGNVMVNLLIGHIVVTAPYVMRTVITSLQLVDLNLEDAARTLGASRMRTFWKVTMPQIAPGVAAGALFAFMVSFDNVPVSLWLADAQYTPVPLLLMHQLVNVFDPSIPAMSTIVIVLALGGTLLLERLVGMRRAVAI